MIVDTNNPAELPASINEAEVIEVIDESLEDVVATTIRLFPAADPAAGDDAG